MTLALKIDDMTCGHCVARVTRAVKSVDPDADLQIDLASHTACIDGSGDGGDFARAIRDAGYTPVVLSD